MELKRVTGPQAGALKYDLLTALAIAGLCGQPTLQTSVLRLIALVTARYNWAQDEFSVGQRDLARMWSVDERTVKREIKRLTESKLLIQLRPGVRGRVAAYRLNRGEIYLLSQPHWEKVGPDFLARMSERILPQVQTPEKVVQVDFRPRAMINQPEGWVRTLHRLSESDPGLHRSWLSGLQFSGVERNALILTAPSAFVAQYVFTHYGQRILDMVRLEMPEVRQIRIVNQAP
jgi:DNA-binding Lrp family transcriptional regulator